MKANPNAISALDLVRPSGQQVRAEITNSWQVYVNGSYETQYAPEEAVCLHGLFAVVDTLQTRTDLFDIINQRHKDAVQDGAIEVHHIAIEALQRVRTKRGSIFRDNLFLLGDGARSRFLLLSNVENENRGIDVIDEYLSSHPAEAGLREGWISSFMQKLTAAQVIDRDKIQAFRKNVSPPKPKVVIIAPQEVVIPGESQEPTKRRNNKRIMSRADDFEPPILAFKEALPRLRQGVESLQSGSQFTLKDIFATVDITSVVQARLDEGLTLLVRGGYIEETEEKGVYVRTSKTFSPKRK